MKKNKAVEMWNIYIAKKKNNNNNLNYAIFKIPFLEVTYNTL